MPVKLRLQRRGRRKAPFFTIVAADSRSPRDGRFIEKIGTYNPTKEPAQLYVDHEAAIGWLKNGAQPTLTVRNLLRHAGVTTRFALIKQGKSDEQVEEIFGRWWDAKQNAKKKKVVIVDREGQPVDTAAEATHEAAPEKAEATQEPAEAAAAEPVVDGEETKAAKAAETQEAPVVESTEESEQPEPAVVAETESTDTDADASDDDEKK